MSGRFTIIDGGRALKRFSASGLAAVLAIAGFAIAGLCLPMSASAQSVLEKLVMPGPLAEGHAKYEGECARCHEPYSRSSQTKLCLDCHKDITADRATGSGLHGRDRLAKAGDCKQCHTEHKGREADITQFDRETFSHDATNFALTGAHRTASCDGCHVGKAKFRKAPTVCFECHKKVEPHRGRLGERCENCHNVFKWRDTKPFDHGKTHFPLVGAHKDVRCTTCHAGEVYKELAVTCVSCHRLQDVHAGRYGEKCDSCHEQVKWRPGRFDHSKTHFPLRGAHEKVKCDSCHTGNLHRDKLATTCVSCHRKQDPHQGKLGERCERCHGETDWRKSVSFDHDLSRFPLVGLHATVPCEECHRSPTYKGEPTVCEKCHRDYHQGRLGGRCADCHNPNGWSRWRFDHARQTAWPLTGAHQKLVCEACHKAPSPPTLKLATDCYSCHRAADPHGGNYGRSCERCHVTTSWRKLSLR